MVDNESLQAILAMVIAHNAAPYGDSTARDYDNLIKEKTLNCGNQSILMGHLLPNHTLRIIGLDGEVLGNHAQVMYENEGSSLLLDPTLSVMTQTTFNELFQGKPAQNVFVTPARRFL